MQLKEHQFDIMVLFFMVSSVFLKRGCQFKEPSSVLSSRRLCPFPLTVYYYASIVKFSGQFKYFSFCRHLPGTIFILWRCITFGSKFNLFLPEIPLLNVGPAFGQREASKGSQHRRASYRICQDRLVFSFKITE